MKIKRFADWGIQAKIIAVTSVPLTAMLLIFVCYFLPGMERETMKDKAASLRNVLDVAFVQINRIGAMEASGKLTREQAQKSAIEILKAVRYGGSNYIFVTDMTPKMVMHPIKPELDGKDLTEDKDPDGKYLFRDMLEVARTRKEGNVNYMWPKPGQAKPVEKMTYVREFEPWGWIIGTGFYVGEVSSAVAVVRNELLVVFFISLLFSGALAYYAARVIKLPVKKALLYCLKLKDGDLTAREKSDSNDEAGIVLDSMSNMAENIDAVMQEVRQASLKVTSSTAELSATAEELAAGAASQEIEASQVAAAMEQMSATVLEVARNSAEAAESAQQAARKARSGGETVVKTVERMENIARTTSQTAEIVKTLGHSSEKIGEIVGVINDIADQTNLLALNAAIEAARAGEQGRGFAVVADEVRNLAERTTKATKEIAEMIRSIQSDTKGAVKAMSAGTAEVEDGVELARNAGQELMEIVDQAERVTEMIQRIAAAAEQQGTTTEVISRNVENIAGEIKRSSQSAHQSSESAKYLSNLSKELLDVIGIFRISGEQGNPRNRAA
ncbi:MAG TPA: methyl-accepting chemotaxis protein [Nitrospirota bacterium]